MTPRTSAATPDPAWLDAQYNNRALVPDFAQHLASWTADSAAVRESLLATGQARLDLPFGWEPTDGLAPPTLDLFLPFPHVANAANAANAATATSEAVTGGAGGQSGARSNGTGGGGGGGRGCGAPVLLFIHGGYWRALDKADHSFVAAPFVAQGACVVVPNYTLVGPANSAARVSHITAQMQQAVRWIWQHAAEWGGDPERITVVGHSAGGQLVAMLLATDWLALGRAGGLPLPAQALASGVAISGLFDMEPICHTPFLADLQLTPDEAQAQSAVHRPAPVARSGDGGSRSGGGAGDAGRIGGIGGNGGAGGTAGAWPRGAMAAVVGGDESSEFHRQNQLIRAAWGEASVPVCESLPGLNHFSVLDSLVQPDSRLHRLVAELLQPPFAAHTAR